MTISAFMLNLNAGSNFMKAKKFVSAAILLALSGFCAAEMSEDQVKQALAATTKQLPTRLDNLTTLNSLFLAPGENIVFRYSFEFDQAIGIAARESNTSTDEIINNSLAKFGTVDRWLKVWGDQYIYPTIRNSNCTAPGPVRFMESGFSLSHEFYDTHGNFLYEMKMTKDLCDRIN